MIHLNVHPALARALAARGYEALTPVQVAVLGDDAAGRDLLVSAQTGSGKTVAFGLALAATLLGSEDRLAPPAEPLALIVAPTRELALQVARELTWLYEAAGARIVTCVGGMDARTEARQLESGAHIVVGTPGRLRDHLERRRLDLSGLAAVVLDEADEMLDLGFREDLEFILDATPAERRTLLFSATLPREIEALAARYQRDAVRLETGRRDEQHADIEYVAHRVVPHDQENAVVNVLRFHEARAAIVFCATREAVNRLSARLVERGFAAVALSGELTQQERTRALQALRDGRARVLVATDVAARGLDLPDLALVVHAELPNDGETLLHRSGRTGRAGKKGLCVLIVPANRRRKADALIEAARLKLSWRPAPAPDAILARDQERFLTDATFTMPAAGEEEELVRAMQSAHSAEAIALALVRMHRARMPAPEDLAIDTGPPPRREWQPRDGGGRGERYARDAKHGGSPSVDERAPRRRREDGRPMTWFRIDIGRDRNADPRWLLPLICRAGQVTKSEIGAIRVDDRETRFEIVTTAADQFDAAVKSANKTEGRIVRVDQQEAVAAGSERGVGAERPSQHSEPRQVKPWRAKPHPSGQETTSSGPSGPGERSEPRPGKFGKKDKSRWRSRGKGEEGGFESRRRAGGKSGVHGGKAGSGSGGGQAQSHQGASAGAKAASGKPPFHKHKPRSKPAKSKKHRSPVTAAE